MLPIITSSSNPRLKAAARLRESRLRRRENRFLIDGVREIERAYLSGIAVEEVYLSANFATCSEGRHAETLHRLIAQFESSRIPVWPITPAVFTKISFGDRNEGIVALASAPHRTLEAFEKKLPERPLLAVLERIEKPGNIGAVFRSADGAGIDGVILADCGDDFFHPNAIRASLGTLFHLPSVSISTDEAVSWLTRRRIPIAAALCDAAISYTEFDFTQAAAIVLGSEADGLTSAWSDEQRRADGSKSVALPMLGVADSLNISAAAAIFFYEARRRRLLAVS